MPKKITADDPYVPMDVMQPQRIKVLEALVASQAKQLAQQTQQIARLTRELSKKEKSLAACQAVDANRSMWQQTKGRPARYTKEMLLGVWKAHEAGESVSDIAKRLDADATMMKIFLKGEYWTGAAKAVYAELGVSRSEPGGRE